MTSISTHPAGEEDFRRLVEPHRGELLAHCYRMLGSVHDAEDALQETLLKAWRGLPRFAERSSIHTWLVRIATNVCLDAIRSRPKRVLPVDYGPATARAELERIALERAGTPTSAADLQILERAIAEAESIATNQQYRLDQLRGRISSP